MGGRRYRFRLPRLLDIALLKQGEEGNVGSKGMDALGKEDSPGSSWSIDRAFAQNCPLWRALPALEVDDKQVTYGELDEVTNRLAHRLLSHGVKSGDIVSVAAEDLIAFAVAALAILKVGAAYLPIDARYSFTRAREVLEQGASKLMLARTPPPAGITPPAVSVIARFDSPDELKNFPSTPPARPQDSGAAYVCYTSGSTGRPKGVLVGHRGVKGLVHDANPFHLSPGDRMGQTSTFAFDAHVLEIWSALLRGACVVEISQKTFLSPSRLSHFLSHARVSHLWLTTSLFNAVASTRPDAFNTLKTLVIGGEAADVASLRQVFGAGGPNRLLNGYGPTEATVLTTCHEITPDDLKQGVIPIGRVLPGRCAHLLDASMRAVPKYSKGELFVGGPGLAIGYLGDAELTRQKFVRDPRFDDGTSVLYRTGDICSERPDGTLIFHGRSDDQIKVRGHRVEPAGVTAVLRELPGVEEAIVTTSEAAFGSKELIGFVRGRFQSATDLRALAAMRLPDYAVPSAIHVLDSFPYTPNGKVDRAELLEFAQKRAASSPARHTATTAEEAALVMLWRRILRRSDIGIDDEFRDLGGNSMSMVALVSEVHKETGVELSIEDVQSPITVRSLANLLNTRRGSTSSAARSGGRAPTAFVVSYPWNMSLLPQPIGLAMAGRGTWCQLQVPPALFELNVHMSVERMAEELCARVLSMSPDGPYTIGGHSFGGILAYEMARQLRDRGKVVRLLVLIDSAAARTPPFRRRVLLPLRRIHRFFRMDLQKKRSALQRKTARAARALPLKEKALDQKIYDSCVAAWRSYKPASYDGPVITFRSAESIVLDVMEFGTDTDPWTALLKNAQQHLTEGDHFSIVESADEISFVAAAIADAMKEGPPLRPDPGTRRSEGRRVPALASIATMSHLD